MPAPAAKIEDEESIQKRFRSVVFAYSQAFQQPPPVVYSTGYRNPEGKRKENKLPVTKFENPQRRAIRGNEELFTRLHSAP
jgi:hypothetical protein